MDSSRNKTHKAQAQAEQFQTPSSDLRNMRTGPSIEVEREDESEQRSSQVKEFRATPKSGKNFIKMNLAVKSRMHLCFNSDL